jgi:hypothetical protein
MINSTRVQFGITDSEILERLLRTTHDYPDPPIYSRLQMDVSCLLEQNLPLRTLEKVAESHE